jgi:hypothetical protein
LLRVLYKEGLDGDCDEDTEIADDGGAVVDLLEAVKGSAEGLCSRLGVFDAAA